MNELTIECEPIQPHPQRHCNFRRSSVLVDERLGGVIRESAVIGHKMIGTTVAFALRAAGNAALVVDYSVCSASITASSRCTRAISFLVWPLPA